LDYARDADARARIEQQIKSPFAAMPAIAAGDWEQLERKRLQQRWSDHQIERADVVILLVGRLTYSRPLVRCEISKAAKLQKPMFGIYVDPKATGLTCPNPFSYVMAGSTGFRYQIHALPTEEVDAYLRQCIEEVLPHPPERRAASSSGGTVLI
jgi:hypothetical protein